MFTVDSIKSMLSCDASQALSKIAQLKQDIVVLEKEVSDHDNQKSNFKKLLLDRLVRPAGPNFVLRDINLKDDGIELSISSPATYIEPHKLVSVTINWDEVSTLINAEKLVQDLKAIMYEI